MNKQLKFIQTALKAVISHFSDNRQTYLNILKGMKQAGYTALSILFHVMLILSNVIIYVLIELYTQVSSVLIEIPYMIYRMIFPKRKYDGSNISRELRRVFESRRLPHTIGIHIIVLILFGMLLKFPLYAVGGYADSSIETIIDQVEVVAEPVIETGSTFQDPVVGYVSQGFHWFHSGIDIAGNLNNDIHPIASGKVVMIEKGRYGYGKQVMISHGGGIYSRYAHMNMINVEIDDYVTHDSVIGYVGSTGWSTGPHLHLEVYKDGHTVNPLSFIPDNYSTQYVDVGHEATTEIATAIQEDEHILGVKAAAEASMASEIVVKEVGVGFNEPVVFNGFPAPEGTPEASIVGQ